MLKPIELVVLPVMAIDPGPEVSGFVIYDGARILEHGTVPNDELPALRSKASHYAIEMIDCYGMPVGRDVFETCVWIGRLEERIGPMHRIFRKDVKLHMCGNLRAKDAHVRQALIDRVGRPGTKREPGPTYKITGHEWSALAVAVTWWDTHHASISGGERHVIHDHG